MVECTRVGNRSFPLSMAVEGDRVRIVMHRGGEGLDKRLASMGLKIDSTIEILQRLGGSLVVGVNDIRFALGAGMAHKILVEPLSFEVP
ncbi:MAG: FeoA family protein [Gammaproteobacteria bacterium]